MLAIASSFALVGIDGLPVKAEVNVTFGLPGFEIVGLPDASVRESRERVRAAIKNSGFQFPEERITVNLAPADLKKEGPAFDLPIAVGLLACKREIPAPAPEDAFIGELSLNGEVRGVRGALPIAISARAAGAKRLFLPEVNAPETRVIDGIDIYPVPSIEKLVQFLKTGRGIEKLECVKYEHIVSERHYDSDFKFVKGQASAKRAMEIAAAGMHNILLIGPPGSGKTLLARCLSSILPDMSFEEALEATRIHSAAGLTPKAGLITERVFRSPHHTASQVSLVGGGSGAGPGEISLAHNGVLFLDELPEYPRQVLETLRQPMEDGVIAITRASARNIYPASFMLVCSMNPCPCGYFGEKSGRCRCSASEIKRYRSRVSGPLLDRIDLHVEVASMEAERMADADLEEPSEAIRARVTAARERQSARYAGTDIRINSRLDARAIATATLMTQSAKKLLSEACRVMELSNRAATRAIRVSRTIADLAGSETVTDEHVAEAVQYRSLDRKYWG